MKNHSEGYFPTDPPEEINPVSRVCTQCGNRLRNIAANPTGTSPPSDSFAVRTGRRRKPKVDSNNLASCAAAVANLDNPTIASDYCYTDFPAPSAPSTILTMSFLLGIGYPFFAYATFMGDLFNPNALLGATFIVSGLVNVYSILNFPGSGCLSLSLFFDLLSRFFYILADLARI